jgi:hypothetical protein
VWLPFLQVCLVQDSAHVAVRRAAALAVGVLFECYWRHGARHIQDAEGNDVPCAWGNFLPVAQPSLGGTSASAMSMTDGDSSDLWDKRGVSMIWGDDEKRAASQSVPSDNDGEDDELMDMLDGSSSVSGHSAHSDDEEIAHEWSWFDECEAEFSEDRPAAAEGYEVVKAPKQIATVLRRAESLGLAGDRDVYYKYQRYVEVVFPLQFYSACSCSNQ